MRRVKVSELKAHLSEYLRAAGGGETIAVCDRDRPIAMLGPWPDERDDLVIRAAERPAFEIATIKGLALRERVDVVELLDREDRI